MEITAQTSDRGKEMRQTLSLHVTTIPNDYLSTCLDALSPSSRMTSPKGSTPSLRFDKAKTASSSRLLPTVSQQEMSLQKKQIPAIRKDGSWTDGLNPNSSVFSDSIQNASKQAVSGQTYPLLFDIILPLSSPPSFHKEKPDLHITGDRYKQGDSPAVKGGGVFSPFPAVSTPTKTDFFRAGGTSFERKRRTINKKDVMLHRLAVEFNFGARIRMTRRGQPRLRSLLYRSS